MRDRPQRPELEQPIKPALIQADATRTATNAQHPAIEAKHGPSAKLEVSPGVKELTGNADWSDAASRHDVSYEVFLEQLAHDMAYEDKLSPDQQALLHRFGYTAAPSVDGPFGFQMRMFTPGKPEFQHPIIAFRGTEFTSGKDLQADLAPQGVGHNQFRANQRRIHTAVQQASRFGRIWVTGHSLGGALAQLTAATYSAAIERVITFQSPAIDAYSVKRLEAHNRAHPDEQVSSTHYQVAGDVVSTAGERLTPGEVVQFDLKPNTSGSGKTMTRQVLEQLVPGGTAAGVGVDAATDAVAKHRAFPVSNAAQEHPAFSELFEQGKSFERVAGINRDTFEARKPISSEVFKNSGVSNFLRFNIGRTVFGAEKAMSDWGKDADARDWAIRNRDRISTFTATNLLEQLGPLLDGWVSDEDVVAFETICYGVRDPKIMNEIRAAIAPRLEELHSESQRRWIDDAIGHQPKVSANGAVQRDRSLEGGGAQDLSVKPFQLSGGRALETAQRERLELHAGINLETVRIFEGDEAAEAAAGYSAKAFTQGENIVLGKGVSLTDELARHETEHVKQQRESSLPNGVDPLHSAEDAAQTVARDFATGQNAAATKPAQLEPAKAAGSVQRLEGKPAAQTPITITFSGQSARAETFSAYSRNVLEDILRATGLSGCTITSTTRTPYDQARIFYQQLTGALPAAAYAAAGEAVRAVGKATIKQKKSRDEVIAAMEAKIRTYNPMSQVSKHLADPAALNVFDVAPSSIPTKKHAAFVKAVNADARVNGFLHPGNSSDPAFHMQVPQGGGTTTPPAPARAVAPAVKASNVDAAPTQDAKAATSTAPKIANSSAVQRLKTPALDAGSAGSTWQNRLFAANLMGTDGDRRINFTLDRQANKITGSFAIGGTGHGNITKGSFDSSDKVSPLKLECQFTDGELAGQTRVLEGWFLYAEVGTRKDENNDGRDDSSKAALPLLIGGIWKGGAKDYKLEPISPSTVTSQPIKAPTTSDSVQRHTTTLEGMWNGVKHNLILSVNGSAVFGSIRKQYTAQSILGLDTQTLINTVEGTWNEKTGLVNLSVSQREKSMGSIRGTLKFEKAKASLEGEKLSMFSTLVTEDAAIISSELIKAKSKDLTLSINGMKMLKGSEGFVPNVYKDNAGKLTVGFGHLLTPGEIKAYQQGKIFKKPLTLEEATGLFNKDASERISDINNSLKVQVPQSVFDVLVSFVFNVGSLSGTDLLKRINLAKTNRDFYVIANEELPRFIKSNDGEDLDGDRDTKEKQNINGLLNRRTDELEYLASGIADEKQQIQDPSAKRSVDPDLALVNLSVVLYGSKVPLKVNASKFDKSVMYPVIDHNKTYLSYSISEPGVAQQLATSRGKPYKDVIGSTNQDTATEFLADGNDYRGGIGLHTGWDFNIGQGDQDLGKPVFAVADSVVVGVSNDAPGGLGCVIILYHPQLKCWTRYAHLKLDSTSVKEGQTITKGHQIAGIGKTGGQPSAHLHFDVIHKRLSSLRDWPTSDRNNLTYAEKAARVLENYSDPAVFFRDNDAKDIRHTDEQLRQNPASIGEAVEDK